jgi:hypothetical protein
MNTLRRPNRQNRAEVTMDAGGAEAQRTGI